MVLSNRPYVSHAWNLAGDYVVELRAYNESYPDGVAASVTVNVVPLPDALCRAEQLHSCATLQFLATAATNIQDAVDRASPGAH